jgi:hypothetical protein
MPPLWVILVVGGVILLAVALVLRSKKAKM